MPSARSTGFVNFEIKWDKQLVTPEEFIKKMHTGVQDAATQIVNRATLTAGGPPWRNSKGKAITNKDLPNPYLVTVLTGNYRRSIFEKTRFKGTYRIESDIGSSAKYAKYVEYYTQNFTEALFFEWEACKKIIYAAAQEALTG